ncbi:DNA replication licensing factor MCM4 [Chondrus crispus]|uniref:DNA replication licensing factor MCM4 n=1 Tax=Chondrus crispus TaxID=2769 RepID=R7QUI7_CHOCR|nr:DNA replication licensing factor MCM4 [Chondrus crispus]CDF40985.1 DNA replication licensing factor MCM4 [Chondrus crispus]|eukprot:XP_005711279.1 DNA replication licensing factor MCM4 [Chondrus crispus]
MADQPDNNHPPSPSEPQSTPTPDPPTATPPAAPAATSPSANPPVTPNRPPPGPSRSTAAAAAAAAASGLGAATPTPAATPDEIVNATPLPLTPLSHRRELGVSPVRLARRPSTSPAASQGRAPQSPADPSQEQQLVLWGTTINLDDAERRLATFLTTFALPDAGEAAKPLYIDLLQHLAETGGVVVNIDMSHLYQADPGMYRKLIAYPNDLIAVFDSVVSKRRRSDLQVRTFNLQQQHVQSMRDLNPKDISTMIAVRGMVIRASNIIPDIQRAMYRCSKCSAMKDVEIQHGRIEEPRICPSCNTRDSFALIHSRSTFADKQTVRLQESPEDIPKGDTPATFTLIMYDTLVDVVKPGDRVEVTGILRATPIRLNAKMRTVRSVYRTYIDCDGATVNMGKEAYTEEQKRARRDYFETLACHPALYERLANSLAPSIFGMTDEKKGVLLQLFGGSSKSQAGQANNETLSDGSSRFRSAINVLLVGDPGTSKSQLLHSAHRLAPRGVYTSGRGSSAVGLTAYVTRDPDTDDYVLESGALVLSDRGVCCIDEFDKMSEFARSVLHEAMEQQTVSIAKAGIIATLNARTAVLAAANPVNSRYDTSKSVVDNIDLPPTLLSRFDLIYLVLDAPDADSDRRLAQHIVSLFFKNYEDGNNQETTADADNEDADLTLTEYMAYAREKVDPVLSEEASEALVAGYLEMRRGGRGGSNMTATPRQLESLIRLAEAHARMQLKDEVDGGDVAEAIRLVKSALHMAAFDPNTGRIDMNLFAAGKSRAAEGKTELLGKVVMDKLGELGGDVRTAELMTKLRESSDADIAPGELREALRRLVETERVVMTGGGSSVRMIS